jgi:CheY-like chemotaxis protein
MEKIKILIAEWEQKNLDRLKEVLEKDEYEVLIATEGVQALQIALQNQPTIIILSLDLPLIDGVKLSQIIRTNPKTESIPFFYMNDRTVQLSHFRRNSDYFIIKPFNVDELRKILGNVRKKLLNVQGLKKEEEFSGNLKQMGLSDLLQVLAMNQRTGNLYIYSDQNNEERKGLITIRGGRMTNAVCYKSVKTKALFRMLLLKDGFFSFLPGEPELKDEINESTDSLLMEGMRQNDELAEMKKSFVSDNIKIYLNVNMSGAPKGLRPKTLEVLSAVEVFPDIRDLMDNVNIHDYEILKIVLGLKEKGVVRIEEDSGKSGEAKADFSSDAILEIKKKILKIYPGIQPPYNLTICVFFDGADYINLLLKALTGFSFDSGKGDVLKLKKTEKYLGFLGTIKLVESLRVNLFYFNDVVPSKPFSNSFMSMAVGAIIFGNKEKFREILGCFGKRYVVLGPRDRIDVAGIKRSLEKIFESFTAENQN